MIFELKENKKYIYIAYAIGIFTLIPQLIASIFSGAFEHTIYLLIVLITILFIAKYSKLLFGAFIVYLNMTNILIWHIFMHWGYQNANITARIEVSALSPKSETLEYLMTYVDYRDVLFIMYTLFILIALYKFIVKFNHTFKKIKLLSIIASIIMIADIRYFYGNPTRRIEPFNILHNCLEAVNHSKFYKLRTTTIKEIKSSSNNTTNRLYNKIIIIQGEAVNRAHMSIYGYDQNTTPFFSSLQAKENFYLFNAIAPTNQTRYSVPILHTKANVENFTELFLHSKSNVGYYRDYGYKTYWISNQGRVGKQDTSISTMAQEANKSFFANLMYPDAKPDQVLISYLNKHTVEHTNELYLFHLMGSHFKYIQRYTQEHVLFKNPINTKEEYDNTIFYTDYILKHIFGYFSKKFLKDKMLFVYISDHGEVVDKDKFGHGFLPPYKDEYNVPFVVYSNVHNDRLDILYNKNKKGYFNLENLNNMIDYVSGISNDLNISYSNKVFALDPKNKFDYNKLNFYKK